MKTGKKSEDISGAEPKVGEAIVLLQKNDRDGMTISELGRVLEIDLAKSARILQVLEAKGLARLRKAGPTKLYFPVRRVK